MLRDRGNIKFTAMMLPEHLVKLKEWKKEASHVKKRELTEWELEELQHIIQRAATMKEEVTVTVWINNRLYEETGLITALDNIKKELLLETEAAVKRFSFDIIQNAMLVNADA